jgi:hypothetical protein
MTSLAMATEHFSRFHPLETQTRSIFLYTFQNSKVQRDKNVAKVKVPHSQTAIFHLGNIKVRLTSVFNVAPLK